MLGIPIVTLATKVYNNSVNRMILLMITVAFAGSSASSFRTPGCKLSNPASLTTPRQPTWLLMN